ncbi:peptidase inhibitor family I36 protein [Melittangium boletus]|uniref:Peptidase inhibitor family I36 n=1 Tax=Melittangium boletus DSM 14713 TaxID=1294270 RepID=A0A250IGB7_9BACT|nr:peptidase inhibitor family I36 protein [Melittangium boletus]ATB30815.1 hypothetical protein MEBOL_004277 [Melittangium boletus DSM 14713]
MRNQRLVNGVGRSTLAAAGLMAIAALLHPAGASAEGSSPCPWANTLCLFEGENFTGAVFNVRALNPSTGTCVNLPEHGWEGRAHSAINTNSDVASMFLNEDCIGGPAPIHGHESLSSLGFTPKSVWVY